VNRPDLQQLAQQYFIADAGLSVANLVRKIQLAEGHRECFSTGKTHCEEIACRWWKECRADATDSASTAMGDATKAGCSSAGYSDDREG
jgi:hypothetical protein